MAGLQYNFFPTDFFFPQQQKAAASIANAPPQVSLLKAKKIGDEIDESSPVNRAAVAINARPPPPLPADSSSSSSRAFAAVPKQKHQA
ncbi:unnamed protein product [Cuscuta campestris]|nr:unnamed protein product [Cuscuta campestris]